MPASRPDHPDHQALLVAGASLNLADGVRQSASQIAELAPLHQAIPA
jgi:hypothetical protein